MALDLSERQQALVFVAVLIPVIAGLFWMTQMAQPAPVPAYGVRSVHLEIDGIGWSIRYDPAFTTNNTAFSLLLEASHALHFVVESIPFQMPQGVFVTSINGSVNGDGGRYWQYWVDGVYASVGSDHMAIHDGDLVAWAFDVPREG